MLPCLQMSKAHNVLYSKIVCFLLCLSICFFRILWSTCPIVNCIDFALNLGHGWCWAREDSGHGAPCSLLDCASWLTGYVSWSEWWRDRAVVANPFALMPSNRSEAAFGLCHTSMSLVTVQKELLASPRTKTEPLDEMDPELLFQVPN
jgi:hypothetical protein